MGYGDKLMAIGDAWALHEADPERRRVAIGDGNTVDKTDSDLCWGLEHFLAPSQAIGVEDVLWVLSKPSLRPYIDTDALKMKLGIDPLLRVNTGWLVRRTGHYIWNKDYRATPAPIVLTPEEQEIADRWAEKGPFVIVEPFIKASAPKSKQWPVANFAQAAYQLQREVPVYQISAPGRPPLSGLPQIQPTSFREALAYLKAAALYVGPEGGLHHGSAAMGTPAVVVFGGYISPEITGYAAHVNLSGDAAYWCGTRYGMCPHCADALNSITVEEVVGHARRLLKGEAP